MYVTCAICCNAMKQIFSLDDCVIPTFYLGILVRYPQANGYQCKVLTAGIEQTEAMLEDPQQMISFRQWTGVSPGSLRQ